MSRGLYSLTDIKARCHVDPDSRCWLWRMATLRSGVPHGHAPPGVIGPRRVSCSARRIAWALAGRSLGPAAAIYPACGHRLCVNPAHLRCGTTGDALRAASARGAFRSPERRAQLATLRLERTTPAAVVQAIADAIESGVTAKRAAALHGVSYGLAKRIRLGQHPHQRPPELAGASAFSWAAAIR